MDYVETIKMLMRKVGADWTDADAIQRDEYRATLGDQRKTARNCINARDEAHRTLELWSGPENPPLQFLPAGLTAEQCRRLSHLVLSRRPGSLALALLVRALEEDDKE